MGDTMSYNVIQRRVSTGNQKLETKILKNNINDGRLKKYE